MHIHFNHMSDWMPHKVKSKDRIRRRISSQFAHNVKSPLDNCSLPLSVLTVFLNERVPGFESHSLRHKIFIINNLRESRDLRAYSRRNSLISATERDERKILRLRVPAKTLRILCSQIPQCPFGEGPPVGQSSQLRISQ